MSSIINSYSHSDVLWDNSIIALNHDVITVNHDFRINDAGVFKVIEIPRERLNADILTAIIEEFILREGTDYGAQEVDFESKVSQVKKLLEAGDVVITYDPQTENCTLLTRQQFHQQVDAAMLAQSQTADDMNMYNDYCQDQEGSE